MIKILIYDFRFSISFLLETVLYLGNRTLAFKLKWEESIVKLYFPLVLAHILFFLSSLLYDSGQMRRRVKQKLLHASFLWNWASQASLRHYWLIDYWLSDHSFWKCKIFGWIGRLSTLISLRNIGLVKSILT